MTTFHVLTGGTSGMGLHIAAALADIEGAHIIAGARSPERAADLRGNIPAERLTVLDLDLDQLDSVSGFSAEVLDMLPEGGEITSIICNAGLQLIGPKEMASPDIERAFLVNHLGHFHLVETMLPRLANGGRVVTVGSGTHNPADKLAKMFGFRGALFPSAENVARGEIGRQGSTVTLGMDRYAASKLCAIYHALHMAQEVPPQKALFYAFDPGLMPGTELARNRSALERFGWYHVLPAMRRIIPGISTSQASGHALVKHCILSDSHASGSYVEFTGRPAPRSKLSTDSENARALIEFSRHLLKSIP